MSHPVSDRRQRERIMLRCPVDVFISSDSDACRATTRDMSSIGVYCVSASAFSPGQRLYCQIEITPRSYSPALHEVYLDCVLEVVRVERLAGEYGIGCRILRYVLRRRVRPAFAAEVTSSTGSLVGA